MKQEIKKFIKKSEEHFKNKSKLYIKSSFNIIKKEKNDFFNKKEIRKSTTKGTKKSNLTEKDRYVTPKSQKTFQTRKSECGQKPNAFEFRERHVSYTKGQKVLNQPKLETLGDHDSFRKKTTTNVSQLQQQIEDLKFNENYKGIYQVLMKELSDFPKNLLEKEKKLNNQISNISDSRRESLQKSGTIDGSGLSKCSFYCSPHDELFSFKMGNQKVCQSEEKKWRESLFLKEMNHNFCSFHIENFSISLKTLYDLSTLYSNYFKVSNTRSSKLLKKIHFQISNSRPL